MSSTGYLMPARHEVVTAARSWLGVPWLPFGRSSDGIDCIGLIIMVGRQLGEGADWLEEPYARFPTERQVRGVLERHLNPLQGNPEPGDIALIRWRRTANHLAFVTDGHEPFGLLHAYATVGRVCEHRCDQFWRDRIAALYTFRSVSG